MTMNVSQTSRVLLIFQFAINSLAFFASYRLSRKLNQPFHNWARRLAVDLETRDERQEEEFVRHLGNDTEYVQKWRRYWLSIIILSIIIILTTIRNSQTNWAMPVL